MELFCAINLYASFFGDVKQIHACLPQEFLICNFFDVVVPVPDFYAVVGAVSENSLSFQYRIEGWPLAGLVGDIVWLLGSRLLGLCPSGLWRVLLLPEIFVWFTNWRVVWSFSAIAMVSLSLLLSDARRFFVFGLGVMLR